jgi:hypothetical protein
MELRSVLRVILLQGDTLLGTEVLVPGTYWLGRSKECAVVLDDERISAKHARLNFDGVSIRIESTQPKSDLRLNEEPFASGEINSLDELQLGRFTLKFKVLNRSGTSERPALEKTVTMVVRPPSDELKAIQAAAERIDALDAEAAISEEVDAVEEVPFKAASGITSSTPTPTPSSSPRPALDPRAFLAPGRAPTPPSSRMPIGLVASPRLAPLPVFARAHAPASRPVQGRGSFDPTQPRIQPISSEELLAEDVVVDVPHALPLPSTEAQPALQARVRWGDQLLRCETFPAGQRPRLGASDDIELPFYSAGLERPQVLAEASAEGWQVQVPASMRAERWSGRAWSEPSASELERRKLTLTLGDRMRLIGDGSLELELLCVPALPTLPKPTLRWEVSLLVPLALAALAAFSLVLYAHYYPQEDQPEIWKTPPRIWPMLKQPVKLKPPPPQKHIEHDSPAVEANNATPAPERRRQPATHHSANPSPNNAASSAISKLLMGKPALGALLNSPVGPHHNDSIGHLAAALDQVRAPTHDVGANNFGLPRALGVQLKNTGYSNFNSALDSAKTSHVGGRVSVDRPEARTIKMPDYIDYSRADIASVINSHIGEVRQCYERALLGGRSVDGKLVVHWTIDKGGTVSQSGIQLSSLPNSQISQCILEHLNNWKFPKPKGEVMVTYPFVFHASDF